MNKLNMESEVICDFYVDEQRKKVWQVELDILEKIVDICNRHNINYTMSGGSLLGVIRHQGFIPWDDDIDIDMLREDYEKFIEIAEKELKPPYFVQYYKSEKGYYYGHAQIRNSNTTGIIKGDFMNYSFNHGIFVDIFPLDNVPDDMNLRNNIINDIAESRHRIEKKKGYKSYSRIKEIIKIIRAKVLYSKINVEEEINYMNKVSQMYNDEKTKEVCLLAWKDISKERKWLNELDIKKFEYLNVKVTKYYDEWLKRQYGDYMQIPENKNGSMHGNVFFDTEKGYLEYKDRLKEITKKL